jgi:nucleoside-diphosphate-sugar epimerase
MKILITGSNGFIGKNLVDKLLEDENIVYGFDNEFTSLITNESRKNYTLNKKNILEICEDDFSNIDVLIHLAAVKKHSVIDNYDESQLFETNFHGTHYLFNLAAKSGVKKIIYTSSLYANGNMHKLQALETDYPRPLTLYGQSKLFGENVLEQVCKENQIHGVALRLYFIYGPHQYFGKGYPSVFISSMKNLAMDRGPSIHNDGLQSLDYLYVDDLCLLIKKILQLPSLSRYDLVNASTGHSQSIRNIIELITDIWNHKAKKNLAPFYSGIKDFTEGTYRSGNNQKAFDIFGWEPSINIDEGISRMIDWYKKQYEIKR